jgi:hypothetical protein
MLQMLLWLHWPIEWISMGSQQVRHTSRSSSSSTAGSVLVVDAPREVVVVVDADSDSCSCSFVSASTRLC